MLESAGMEMAKKVGEAALSKGGELNLQTELTREMAQQETFRIGELSRPELTDLGSLKERETGAAEEIRGEINELTIEEDQADSMNMDKPGELASLPEDTGSEAVDRVVERPSGIETLTELPSPSGGAYGDLPSRSGYEKHHMPADSTTNLEYRDGPCILMETSDHRQTASWGSSREAKAYRAEQINLKEKGKNMEAFEMDVQDIKSKFADKYDTNISQAESYANDLKAEGRF